MHGNCYFSGDAFTCGCRTTFKYPTFICTPAVQPDNCRHQSAQKRSHCIHVSKLHNRLQNFQAILHVQPHLHPLQGHRHSCGYDTLPHSTIGNVWDAGHHVPQQKAKSCDNPLHAGACQGVNEGCLSVAKGCVGVCKGCLMCMCVYVCVCVCEGGGGG